MSKVITFSRTFPAYHPKKGQPTFFVEKFYNSLEIDIRKRSWIGMLNEINGKEISSLQMLANFVFGGIDYNETGTKHHTIRAGNRFKAGDYFSPRVWSGIPYNSKQIIIAPDIKIVKVFDFEMDLNGVYSIDGKYLLSEEDDEDDEIELARNDGFDDPADMFKWFMPNYNKPKEFKGQIICWNKNINY